MASNFPQMGGAGQMMPQQQQQQQQQQQVHMQMHPNRQPQQLNHMIYQKLQQQGAPPSGWQQMVPAQERMAVIFNM